MTNQKAVYKHTIPNQTEYSEIGSVFILKTVILKFKTIIIRNIYIAYHLDQISVAYCIITNNNWKGAFTEENAK